MACAPGEHDRWDGIWKAGLGRGEAFDADRVEPALQALIDGDDGGRPLPGGVALVPGCGRGYAVAALASPERSVVGLELSETAAEVARKFVPSAEPKGEARVEVGDFFAHKGAYSLVYDCTFLCAIPPDWRPKWGDKMSELVSPGGEIVLLVFPIADHEGGPPYALTPEHVEDLLVPRGFEKISCEMVPQERVARNFKGKEAIARYVKKA
eukprot:PRCOL_00002738-RA